MAADQKIKDLAEALSWMTNFITSWREAAATNSHGDMKNSAGFIINFITIINGVSDSYDLSFDGDGSYFGKQISISFDARFSYTERDIAFEICYDENQMVIYTKHHKGFWVVPYVTVTTHDDAFEKLKVAIHSAIHRLMDLKSIEPEQKLKQYFIREIGEGDWKEVSCSQYRFAQLDPTMDTKTEVV